MQHVMYDQMSVWLWTPPRMQVVRYFHIAGG